MRTDPPTASPDAQDLASCGHRDVARDPAIRNKPVEHGAAARSEAEIVKTATAAFGRDAPGIVAKDAVARKDALCGRGAAQLVEWKHKAGCAAMNTDEPRCRAAGYRREVAASAPQQPVVGQDCPNIYHLVETGGEIRLVDTDEPRPGLCSGISGTERGEEVEPERRSLERWTASFHAADATSRPTVIQLRKGGGIRHTLGHGWLMRAFFALVLAVYLLFAASLPGLAQQAVTPEALAREAQALDDGPDTPTQTLLHIRAILDRIVAEHPSSDLAVAILLQETVEGLDVADLDARLDAASNAAKLTKGSGAKDFVACVARGTGTPGAALDLVAEIASDGRMTGLPLQADGDATDASQRVTYLTLVAAIDACTPVPSDLAGGRLRISVGPSSVIEIARVDVAAQSVAQGGSRTPQPEAQTVVAGDDTSEAALNLDRQTIRDLQARLLVSGHDPNGIDGSIGPGTRGALRAWQSARGIDATGFLSGEQLSLLRTTSQTALDAWLRDPANAARYEPPPPIALTPRRMTGAWSFTTRCGARSRLGQVTIRGALSVVHAGGRTYRGRAQNSQGLRGDFSGELRGRTLVGQINWGLLIGRTQFEGRIADSSLTISGRDTNGCSFSASKQ